MSQKEPVPQAQPAQRPKCGIVMPISAIDGCGADHWKDVLSIIKNAGEEAGFDCEFVSTSEESGIIQNRIVTNLYHNEMVICDVSCKNPNVMFELGLRLAFDKPTIVIKDDKTEYSFDTSPIEHITYPRDLRFSKIIDFKEALTQKIKSTHKKAMEDPEYSTFLKYFGDLKVKGLTDKEASLVDYIKDFKNSITNDIELIKMSINNQIYQRNKISYFDQPQLAYKANSVLEDEVDKVLTGFLHDKNIPSVKDLGEEEQQEFILKCYKWFSRRYPRSLIEPLAWAALNNYM